MERLLAEVEGSSTQEQVYLRATVDGKLLVSAEGLAGQSSERELVVTTYRCKTAFTGASVGDTITNTQVIDISGSSPSTVSNVWRNQTTAADLGSAPSAANLELTGAAALTDAQLRASAISTKDQAGSGAMRYLSDTTALTAVSYSYIQVITDTVFATLTNTNSTAGTLTTLTIPAGTVLRVLSLQSL
jgi:hypothetical protein